MDLEPTEDQVALVEELRRLLARSQRWDDLAGMGVLALPVPEGDGGVGLGWAEAVLAFQELGRAQVAGPYVATAAANAVGLADGVTGLVPAASPVVVEHLDDLDSLLAVDVDGVRRIPLPLDGARAVERPLDPGTSVHVVDALPPGEPVGDAEVAAALSRGASLLASAMQVGLGLVAVELGAAYAMQRHQFGRPIGSFQAIKHLLADAAVGLEVARAAVDAAAVMLDERSVGADRAIAAARIVASDAAGRATRACIQVHGGMGYTWELDAHLLLKRALVLDQTPSTVEEAIEALA
jgi:alkylation response protein AidB-like acyl-CoA dehydrogenase